MHITSKTQNQTKTKQTRHISQLIMGWLLKQLTKTMHIACTMAKKLARVATISIKRQANSSTNARSSAMAGTGYLTRPHSFASPARSHARHEHETRPKPNFTPAQLCLARSLARTTRTRNETETNFPIGAQLRWWFPSISNTRIWFAVIAQKALKMGSLLLLPWSPRVLHRCHNGPPRCQNGGTSPCKWQLWATAMA